MRVLLLSAYTAVSHRHWVRGLTERLHEAEWTLLELPPRHFRWRIRGNPLTWMLKEDATLAQEYDVVLATSMVDLATLIGLYPHLAHARKIVYFHENQFAYPAAKEQKPGGEALMVNLYAALAADVVVFNSAYNRDSFIDGARAFLKRLPENLPAAKPLERLRERARVLPVPLDPVSDTLSDTSSETTLDPGAAPLASSGSRGNPNGGGRIVWNHRWEYDKNPEDFFAALVALSERGIGFELAVMGQRFRDQPAIFAQARERLSRHVVAWGPQPAEAYRALLDEADIVVSTTWHEFQGLSIMEAAQRGALPLVPNRLCFPELYPLAYRYDGSREGLIDRLEDWLIRPESRPPRLDMSAWTWPALASHYRRLLMP
ncbi:tRNA-queuosine alpha-mannosyltransferase domain-containing protein [Halomonas korlensis]|uniref:tRNA-queuosine alpha-mannosyltransferase n=1 Tax=Halomonas korlensis TaxID=463301 RepID=A0A1I7JVA3_9GAMM|nr:DUF3524 domain-containing protein [Halomonas korlensis]SFU89066.1 Glycosyl transferases group 1 [Halomonas korlensis]